MTSRKRQNYVIGWCDYRAYLDAIAELEWNFYKGTKFVVCWGAFWWIRISGMDTFLGTCNQFAMQLRGADLNELYIMQSWTMITASLSTFHFGRQTPPSATSSTERKTWMNVEEVVNHPTHNSLFYIGVFSPQPASHNMKSSSRANSTTSSD